VVLNAGPVGYDRVVSDTPGVPPDPDDPETDELPVSPGAGEVDRDDLEEGVEELLDPPPPEGGPTSDADAPPPG
jgi:hypothetical protein